MSEQNKAVVRRYMEEIWNKDNLAAMEEFCSKDINHQDPVIPETRGIEAVKQLVSTSRTGFPDRHYTLDDIIAEGDKVVLRCTLRGTHKGEFLGIAATGKQVKVTATATHRLSGGKIVEAWYNWDALGMMQQLGVTTLPASK